MADLIIKVSSEEVRAKAQEITAQRSLMEACMQDMAAKVSQLGDCWKAPSGEAYIEKYQNVTRNIQKSLDVLSQHVNNLTEAANSYEQEENGQKLFVDVLSADGVF